jgi:hypothetical protein
VERGSDGTSGGRLRRCIIKAQRLLSHSLSYLENELSNLTLERIEQELRLLNANMAEANDIAMLAAYSSMPADLAEDSRQALRRLRDKMMERAKTRADL